MKMLLNTANGRKKDHDGEEGNAMVKTVVWDWNGTLLDDVEISRQVMNRMLSRRELPVLETREQYQEIFTFPVRDYYRDAGLDLDQESFEDLAEEWTVLYGSMSQGARLFENAQQVLERLQQGGFHQLIVSASPQKTLERQVTAAGIQSYFEALLGISDIYAQGKSGVARRYFVEHGVDSREVLFVGDTLHDWEVAGQAGCPCVLITAGHQGRRRLETCGAPLLDGIQEVPAFCQNPGN